MSAGQALPGGLSLAIRLTPRGGRAALGPMTEIEGREVLTARVPEPPVDGRANAALLILLARKLSVPKSAVTLVAGDRARLKRVEIAGDPAELRTRLARALEPG